VRIAIALAVLTTIAHAETPPEAIARAKQLEAKLSYDEALVIVEAAIAAGKADRAQLLELHLIAGRLSAGLDRTKPAEEHFAVVLALDPTHTLGDDVSPKITVPFTVARTRTQPLAPKLVITQTDVAIEGAAPLVTGIALRLQDGTTREARTAPRIARPAQPIASVRALDRHGNELWSATPPPEQVAHPPPVVRAHHPHLLARWTTWAAVTGVALATGGVAAWRFRIAKDDFDTASDDGASYTRLRTIEDRADRWALVTNISLGVAAATAITSVIFFVRRPTTEPTVTVTAGPGSLGVAGRF
jgi:hypothetical protein